MVGCGAMSSIADVDDIQTATPKTVLTLNSELYIYFTAEFTQHSNHPNLNPVHQIKPVVSNFVSGSLNAFLFSWTRMNRNGLGFF